MIDLDCFSKQKQKPKKRLRDAKSNEKWAETSFEVMTLWRIYLYETVIHKTPRRFHSVGVVILSKPVSHMNKLGKFLNESENQLNVIYEWELSEKL